MKVTDEMVSRFLSWSLPKDFGPDCGIKFTPINHPNCWPIGTNLLTADQARQMLEHVLSQYSETTAGSALLPGLKAALEIAERYLPDEGVRFLRNDIKDAILKNAATQEAKAGRASAITTDAPAVAAPDIKNAAPQPYLCKTLADARGGEAYRQEVAELDRITDKVRTPRKPDWPEGVEEEQKRAGERGLAALDDKRTAVRRFGVWDTSDGPEVRVEPEGAYVLYSDFAAHTKAVAGFLNELYAIMVDPCADGSITVADMKAALVKAALRDREAADLTSRSATPPTNDIVPIRILRSAGCREISGRTVGYCADQLKKGRIRSCEACQCARDAGKHIPAGADRGADQNG